MKTKWISQDGYHEEHQYIDTANKRILGIVNGSKYEEFDGWHARIEDRSSAERLGRFTTMKAAKSAVEIWWAEKYVDFALIGGKG